MHFNFIATITTLMCLVKVMYEPPLISLLRLFGSKNAHCLQKGYDVHTNNVF